MGEAIKQSWGSRYQSEIQKKDLVLLIGEDDCVDEVLNAVPPKTQDEEMVLELYRRMIVGEEAVENHAQWTPKL